MNDGASANGRLSGCLHRAIGRIGDRRRSSRHRAESIGLARTELIVPAGRSEILGGSGQNLANLGRFQRWIALDHQRREAADIGGGERGAGRHLILTVD